MAHNLSVPSLIYLNPNIRKSIFIRFLLCVRVPPTSSSHDLLNDRNPDLTELCDKY